jgi:hypothetical protein
MTAAHAVDALLSEINRLNNRHWNHDDGSVIVSTNIKPTLAGRPQSGTAQPQDTGAAVYFNLRIQSTGKALPVVLACDRWNKVAHNIYAMAKHVEALRGQDRWGVGRIEQAFRGYTAIPEKTGGLTWWEIIGCNATDDAEKIKAKYHLKAQALHPDRGGTHEQMVQLNAAFELAMNQNGRVERAVA